MSAALYPASANGFALFGASPKDSFHLQNDLWSIFSPNRPRPVLAPTPTPIFTTPSPVSSSSKNKSQPLGISTLTKIKLFLLSATTASRTPSESEEESDVATDRERSASPPPPYTEFGEFIKSDASLWDRSEHRLSLSLSLKRSHTSHA